ncbi:MAG: hypothetical protein AB1344_09240 [Pseudomonadota bacterium]
MRRLILTAVLLMVGGLCHAEIGIHASLSKPDPWLREEVLLTVEVLDDRSIIEQSLTPWTPAGVALRPLSGQQERIRTADGVRILHKHRWAVMPLYPGPLVLQPPPVEIRTTGSGRQTLTPPALRLETRPLDPLLPVDVPVSALRIEAAPLPEAIPRGRPVVWTLGIEGQGLSARGVRRWLDEALRDTRDLRVYPPDIQLQDNIDPMQPLRQRSEARITLEPRASGAARLPEIKLPYIHPVDGQMRLAVLEGRTVRVMHPLWQAVKPWLLWGLMAIVLAGIGMLIRPIWRRWRTRDAWIKRLEAAESAHELRKAWRQGAATDIDHASAEAIDRLDAACYGRQPLDEKAYAALKARLIRRTRNTP